MPEPLFTDDVVSRLVPDGHVDSHDVTRVAVFQDQTAEAAMWLEIPRKETRTMTLPGGHTVEARIVEDSIDRRGGFFIPGVDVSGGTSGRKVHEVIPRLEAQGKDYTVKTMSRSNSDASVQPWTVVKSQLASGRQQQLSVAGTDVENVKGVSGKRKQKLASENIYTAEQLASASEKTVASALGVDPETANTPATLIENANKTLES